MQLLTSSKTVKLVDFNTLKLLAEQEPVPNVYPDSIDVEFCCNTLLYRSSSYNDVLRFYRVKEVDSNSNFINYKIICKNF